MASRRFEVVLGASICRLEGREVPANTAISRQQVNRQLWITVATISAMPELMADG
jgi:hypothetical protein